ncbi:pleckstrin homology domain-containing family A member 4 isoform X2 [Spea bombifrons]|uniref:pleckstrin homology domain-containing family A member 4 isoform X2 n=1 Tax=Spea bombifrons TaxID=233779 RepID=UPI00234BAD81|nr:pleckstrin homology domain-containing family A member 4 isoform X2 [Spea bombifrons]
MTEEMERPRSGLSMASSVVTTASVNQGSRPSTRSVKRVHTFGKREYSLKRDPNSPVVIRGWLYKQDSSGLRLWKRRWFVLCDFCLFYYRDSREETVLGSILLPSYEILPASPREVKNRRFSFKAEHPGMRTYYFGADTQEDMNAWIRAMNQSALVVAEDKNKASHTPRMSGSPHDDLYASYEDFPNPGINPSDHAKSAESLEIAQLSESRSQDESSRESLQEQDRNGDFEKDSLFSGLRESLTDAMQQYTSISLNGSVPPPTPENGVKNMEVTYNREEVESKGLERKDSIPEDEEWVPFHKDQSAFKDPLESYSTRSPSRVLQKGFECPHDVYASPLSRSAPSSPAVLPAHIYNTEVGDRIWSSRDEKSVSQTELPDTPDGKDEDLPNVPSSPSRTTTGQSPARAEYVLQRVAKASRSHSLPPTPSEISRHRIVRSSPPNKYGSPCTSEKVVYYPDNTYAIPVPSTASPTRKDAPITPSLSPRVQQARPPSNDDLAVPGSPSQGRVFIRSNTPIGRVDMLPLEERSSNSVPSSRHNEERSGEYFVTNSRTRCHIVKSSLSRPQTPSDRYDVLPCDDPYSSSSVAKGPGRYSRRSQPLGPEDERLVDGCGVPLPPRSHLYSNRMQMRPNAPADRVIVEEYPPEVSLTPSLMRHRGQASRYSERSLLPPAVCSGRGLGSAPRHLSKMGSASYSQLPPLPPVSNRPGPHVPSGKRMSISVMPSGSTAYRERGFHPSRLADNSIDVILTKLCGQDKLLVSIEDETTHLRAEKEKLEDALQVTHHHLDEFQGQDHVIENIWYQQRLLQDDLVYVRARLCDLSLERERAWEEYRVLESEMNILRETLERVSQMGHPQDQAAANRDLWMINDIISGLRFSKANFHVIPEPTRHPVIRMASSPAGEPQSALQRSFLHHSGLNPLGQRETQQDFEGVPPRPPLPKDHNANSAETDAQSGGNGDQNEQDQVIEQQANPAPVNNPGQQTLNEGGDPVLPSKDLIGFCLVQSTCPLSIPKVHKITSEPKASPPNVVEVGTVRKPRMSAEEQMERMRRHQEAQIHERPKPGVTTQRQNSQRVITATIGGRLGSSSESLPVRANSQQADKPPSEQRKPALVRVTASFYPSTTSTPQSGKIGSGKSKVNPTKAVQDSRTSAQCSADEPTYSVLMEPQTESVTSITSLAISPVAKSNSNQMLFQASSSSTVEPNSTPRPEQLDVKRQTVAGTSPGTSPGGFSKHSDEGNTITMEGERERIMSLSHTLAAEASRRGKIMTAKAFADDCDEGSDISSSDEIYPWDFIMQDSYSKRPDVNESSQFRAASNSLQAEGNPAAKLGGVCQPSKLPRSSGETCSPQPKRPESGKDLCHSRNSENQHYENWSAQNNNGNSDHCPTTRTETVTMSKCNGQVANYDFLIEDLHYHPLDITKVADYCKEEREPIRITLLQSSF